MVEFNINSSHVQRTLAFEPYQIDYVLYYEPYVVARKTLPPFSEIFRGYGNDKDQWFRELYLRDYQFWVLPDVFTVHFEHEEANWVKLQFPSKLIVNRVKLKHLIQEDGETILYGTTSFYSS